MTHKVVKKIATDKLSALGIEEKKPERVSEGTLQRSTRKTTFKPSPKPVTSWKSYAERYPAIKTPSVLSKDKADKTLLALQELPWPEKEARYSEADWNRLVRTVTDYFLDVVEGAGLISKKAHGDALRHGFSELLKQNFNHLDPHDLKYRSIKVEDK